MPKRTPFNHIRVHVFRGLLAVTPVLMCAGAIYLLYVLIDKKIIGLLSNFFNIQAFPGLGILLVLVALYLIGLIVSNIIGRRLLKAVEKLTTHIPFIKSIYGVGKQLSQSFSTGDKAHQAFKKMVLVKYGHNDILIPAFVMSTIVDEKTKEELLFVYMPNVPSPPGGFIFLVKASQTVDPGWSGEECLKTMLSFGIVPPKSILHSK